MHGQNILHSMDHKTMDHKTARGHLGIRGMQPNGVVCLLSALSRKRRVVTCYPAGGSHKNIILLNILGIHNTRQTSPRNILSV